MSATIESVQAFVSSKLRETFREDVQRFPLSGPEGMKTPHYGLFLGTQCIGFACKKNYNPHTIEDMELLTLSAIPAFPSAIEDVSISCYWTGDAHVVSLAPSREYRKAVFGSDTIWPRLLIHAGYDGSSFKASLGFYRDACKNMAIIRSAGRGCSAAIRHSSHLRDKLDDLRKTFAKLANGWSDVVETAQRMESHNVQLASFLAQVYPMPEDATRRIRETHEQRIAKIIRRIQSERLQLRGTIGSLETATAWEAWNGVQGYVQHEQRRHGRPSAFARAIMAIDDSAVARAMELALAV